MTGPIDRTATQPASVGTEGATASESEVLALVQDVRRGAHGPATGSVESEQRACQILGFECGYRKTAERERVIGEASATMVWETIANLQPLPLLWNAYPFHPYRPGQPLSNRPPSARELRSGGEFLAELLRLYAVDTVIAVGNSAANGLKQAGLTFLMVRHPSHGGKTKFFAGLESVADETGAFRQARAN